MGLRERKKILVQEAIEAAALRLFQQKGYEQTSIQDIADAVTMSTRTFFRYFASKEDLLFMPMRIVLEEGISYLKLLASEVPPPTVLARSFVYIAGLYQERRASFLVRYQVAMVSPQLASMYLFSLATTEPALCEALFARQGADVDQRHIRVLVAIYMATFRVAMEEWLGNGVEGDLASLLHEYFEELSLLL